MATRRYGSHSDFIHRADGHKTASSMCTLAWMTVSSSRKCWSWLRLCIISYRASLHLTEQKSRLDLKTNRPKTQTGPDTRLLLPSWWDWLTVMTSTEALEEPDFPCYWASEQLKVDLGKMLEHVTTPQTQVLVSALWSNWCHRYLQTCFLTWQPLPCLSLGKSWEIRTWALWFLNVN